MSNRRIAVTMACRKGAVFRCFFLDNSIPAPAPAARTGEPEFRIEQVFCSVDKEQEREEEEGEKGVRLIWQ